jgi:hypothetical protein
MPASFWSYISSIHVLYCGRVNISGSGSFPLAGKCFLLTNEKASLSVRPCLPDSMVPCLDVSVSVPPLNLYAKGCSLQT